MLTSNQQRAGRERRPWAVGQALVLAAGAATLFALVRVFRVSGGDASTALAVFRYAGGLDSLRAILVTDVPRFVTISWLLALAAFLEAEHPLEGRDEREVQLLGGLVLVLGVAMLVVSHIVIATPVLLLGAYALVSRKGGVARLKAMLGRRVGARRSDATLSDSDSGTGDEQATLSDSDHEPAVMVPNRRLRVGILCVALGFLAAQMWSSAPWLPAELVTLTDGSTIVGYVLDDSRRDIWLLDESMRVVLALPADEVASRVICDPDFSTFRLSELIGASDPSGYPACPGT